MKVCLNSYIRFFKTFASVFCQNQQFRGGKNNSAVRNARKAVSASTITSFSKEDVRAVTVARTDQKTDLISVLSVRC